MDSVKLLELVRRGEDSQTQFKESIQSADALAAEITAFLNAKGGVLLIGVTDNGELKGLSAEEIVRLNQLISNVCTQNIEPRVSVETKNIVYDDKVIVAITVPMGTNKFYMANGTDVWIKVGADKRRARREELQRLLQEAGHLYADEQVIAETGIIDLEPYLVREFINKKLGYELDDYDAQLSQLLENMKLMKDGQCTLAGLLLFGKGGLRHYDFMKIGAMAWHGNEIDAIHYRESEDIHGDFARLFRAGKSFIMRQLRKLQQGDNPNYLGVPEIPEIAIEEALINALVHRNYFMASYVRLHIFEDRIEIISPGTLPNTLTIESIKHGVHISRNPIVLSYVKDLPGIPYRGMGTGISRILKSCKDANVKVEFDNDEEAEQFKVIFGRKSL